MDRHDLSERAARYAAAVTSDAFEQIKSAGMCFGCCLGTHPADDLFRIGEERENRSGRGGNMGLPSDDERFIHRCLLKCSGDCFAG